jgi:ferredoxin
MPTITFVVTGASSVSTPDGAGAGRAGSSARGPGGDPTRVRTRPGEAQGATLLAVARAHNVPIPFNCESGACGACLVDVRRRDGRPLQGSAPTESEALLLKVLGAASAGAIDAARHGGTSPAQRLACQYVPGGSDEDLVVTFASHLGS